MIAGHCPQGRGTGNAAALLGTITTTASVVRSGQMAQTLSAAIAAHSINTESAAEKLNPIT